MEARSTPATVRGERVVGRVRQELIVGVSRRYEAGETIRSLATDLDRSYGFILCLLKESGVSLRGRGGATRGTEAIERRRKARVAVEQVKAQFQDVDAERNPEEPKWGRKDKKV